MRTTNGETVIEAIRKLRDMETSDTTLCKTFEIDGKSSKYINNEDKTVKVEYDIIYVVLKEGKNEIKLPNYGHYASLAGMIENAAEILLWEHGMEV